MQKLGGISLSGVSALGLGWLVCCAALAGCDGKTEEDGDGGPSAAPVGADDFAARFAARYCGSIGACCQRFDEAFELGECTASVDVYLRSSLQSRVASLKVVFDEVAAGRCIDAYGDAMEGCTDRDKSDALETACAGLLRGTLALGEPCSEGIECQRSAGERVTCSSGVCTLEEEYFSLFDAPHAELGEPCAGTCEHQPGQGGSCTGDATSMGDQACWIEDGLVCREGVCAKAPTLGEACAWDCARGSYCAAGTCVAALTTGPCPLGNECAPTSFCDYDPESPECVPLRADGDACDSSDECLGGDCEGDRCREWSVASRESCAGLFDD